MSTLRVVLGDHLTRDISSLADIDPSRDIVLMMEVMEEATYVPHHKQKIVFVLSAMRHFAEGLQSEGIAVDYVALDAPGNLGSFTDELVRAVERHRPERVVVTEPGEYRVLSMMRKWHDLLGVPIEIREDDRFFCSLSDFTRWAEGRTQLRMEFFYREMRRKTAVLMDGEAPAGGAWNFDQDNRKPLPRDARLPTRRRFEPDSVTQGVMQMVGDRFASHFGSLAAFGWAVTRPDALEALDHFITVCLPSFGDYQDAMKQGNAFLHHAVISPYLNVGLLTAREVCARAEKAWRTGAAPLNAVEGFIRQILGWREYVRGLYWLKMPGYAESNALHATRDLPGFYWTGETTMNCLAQVIGDTQRHAYAHHIQRLMVIGNFALLAGLAPRKVEAWYLLVYADAFEWVELPNTHGMALFADGGVMASKPYAASGAYIDRMSDYCTRCAYDPKRKTGEKACPFNYLYWDFLARNEERLKGNPRLAMPYRTLARMDAERRAAISADARRFLSTLDALAHGADQLVLEI